MDLKKYGFSRELVCRVLRSQPMKDKYGVYKEIERRPSIVEKTSRKIKRALNQEIPMQMELAALMSTQDRNNFLHASGYKTKEKRCSSSINVLEFCEVVQEYQQRYSSQN